MNFEIENKTNITINNYNSFGLFFSKPIFPLFLMLPDRKILDLNGPYISTSQTERRNVRLSAFLELYLSSSAARLQLTSVYLEALNLY